MVGIYFSGTGNTKYCVETFLKEYDNTALAFSIEEENVVQKINEQQNIVFGYPVQFSNIPKILKDFIVSNSDIWKNKKKFIIATMGLFSGDGSGMLARLLSKYGAIVVGGLHLKMPDCIGDKKALKRSLQDNQVLVKNSVLKIKSAVCDLKSDNPPQEGIGLIYHFAGLFGQRLYFYNKTRSYSDKLKIDNNKCIGCGKCIKLCPMKNIHLNKQKAVSGNMCTMCYRCISKCPTQAITLLGKRIFEQCYIEKYL